MKLFRRLLMVGLVLAHAASAAPPEVVRFHGAIGQLGDGPVIDGNYILRAEIFEQATGGVALYTQDVTAMVSAGSYTMVLSPATAGDLNAAFADSPRFLQITVTEGPMGDIPDAVLLPRQEIASVPFALAADHADLADVATQSTTAATTAVPGVVQLATDAEAMAATVGDRALTPANLAANYDDTPTAGYSEILGTGLLLQWTNGSVGNGETLTFVTPFADTNYTVASSIATNHHGDYNWYLTNFSTSEVQFHTGTSGSYLMSVIAIGKKP